MQGIIKDENDINMLGEDFRLAYQQRRGNELSEESWTFPQLSSCFATRCQLIPRENFHLLLTVRNSFFIALKAFILKPEFETDEQLVLYECVLHLHFSPINCSGVLNYSQLVM